MSFDLQQVEKLHTKISSAKTLELKWHTRNNEDWYFIRGWVNALNCVNLYYTNNSEEFAGGGVFERFSSEPLPHEIPINMRGYLNSTAEPMFNWIRENVRGQWNVRMIREKSLDEPMVAQFSFSDLNEALLFRLTW